MQLVYQFLKGKDISDGVELMDNLFEPQFIG